MSGPPTALPSLHFLLQPTCMLLTMDTHVQYFSKLYVILLDSVQSCVTRLCTYTAVHSFKWWIVPIQKLPIFLEMSLLLILCSINSLMLETVVLLFYKRTSHYPLKLSMQVWRSLAVWKSVVDVLVFIRRGVRVKLFLLVLFAFCSVSHVVWQQLRQRWFLIKAKEKSFWITRTDKLCMLKPETFY